MVGGVVVDDSESVASNTRESLLRSVVPAGSSVIVVGGDDALADGLADHGCAVDRVGVDGPAPQGTGQVVVVASGALGSVSPAEAVARAGRWLAPDGRLVVLLGNAAHGNRRLAVLVGRRLDTVPSPDGTPGLDLDTRDHALDVLAEAGFRVTEVRATVVTPQTSDEVPAGLVAWVRHQPESHEATFAVVAVAGDPAPCPPLTTFAVERSDADERWESMPELDGMEAASQEITRLRRALLTARDHQIGMLAQAGTLRREQDRLRGERAMIMRSPDWRVGRMVVAPARMMKRALRGMR